MDSRFFKILKAQVTFIIVGILAISAIIFGFIVMVAAVIFAPIIRWINQSRSDSVAGDKSKQEHKQSGDFIDVEFEVIDEKDKKD